MQKPPKREHLMYRHAPLRSYYTTGNNNMQLMERIQFSSQPGG